MKLENILLIAGGLYLLKRSKGSSLGKIGNTPSKKQQIEMFENYLEWRFNHNWGDKQALNMVFDAYKVWDPDRNEAIKKMFLTNLEKNKKIIDEAIIEKERTGSVNIYKLANNSKTSRF